MAKATELEKAQIRVFFAIKKARRVPKPLPQDKTPVECIDDNIPFESLTEASVHYKVTVSAISQACKNNTKVKGKRFRYER